MRVLIFSDVHAISQATTALEEFLPTLNPDAIWFLGDMVGRGPSPHRVVRTIRAMLADYGGVAILGNHDMSVLGRLSGGGIQVGNQRLTEDGFALNLLMQHRDHAECIQEYSASVWEWMNGLPLTAMPLAGYYLAHGYLSPTNLMRTIWDYGTKHEGILREQVRTARATLDTPPSLIALGHYHIAGLWQWHDDQITTFDIWNREWIELDNLSERPVILNSGTLCLPRRDGDHGNYVILDLDDDLKSLRVGFRHLMFDWRPLLDVFRDGYVNAAQMRKEIRRNLLPPGIEPPEEGD